MEDKSITSMIITVLISVVIVGAVLVPILGEVSDNGGNGGGNGGSSGESEQVILTNIGESIGVTGLSYKSYQIVDTNVGTGSEMPIVEYTLDDLREIESTLKTYDWSSMRETKFPVIMIYEDTEQFVAGTELVEIYYDSSSSELCIGLQMDIFSPFDVPIDYFGSLEFGINSDHHYWYNAKYYRGEEITDEKVTTIVPQYLQSIQQSEEGWIDLMTNLSPNVKITDGSELFIQVNGGSRDIHLYNFVKISITKDMIENNTLSFTVSVADENSGDIYSVDYTMSLLPTETEGIWTFSLADDLTGIIKDSSGTTVEESSANGYPLYATTYGYTQSESESGSGSGGMSNVLLGIIPVFVLLGILIYAVQYLRPDNKL